MTRAMSLQCALSHRAAIPCSAHAGLTDFTAVSLGLLHLTIGQWCLWPPQGVWATHIAQQHFNQCPQEDTTKHGAQKMIAEAI